MNRLYLLILILFCVFSCAELESILENVNEAQVSARIEMRQDTTYPAGVYGAGAIVAIDFQASLLGKEFFNTRIYSFDQTIVMENATQAMK